MCRQRTVIPQGHSEAANALGSTSARLGKGEMAARSFSAEAERHSLKRSSRVTTDWMSNAFALRFRPLAETKVRLIFYH